MSVADHFDHPSFFTAFGTVFGYLLILTAMTLLIFVVPYLFFLFL